jgi:D-alanine-D-alanine ligase
LKKINKKYMNKKIKVAVICGGKSAEHEVSLRSANSIISAIDRKKYAVAVIGIEKNGRWYFYPKGNFILNAGDPKRTKLNQDDRQEIILVSGKVGAKIHSVSHGVNLGSIQAVFPVLHGPFGEDGTVQGFLKLMDIPFVGPSVLGSAVGMDKEIAKRILRDNKIPIADFLVFSRTEKGKIGYTKVRKILGSTIFIKPANLGSSVGISKAKNEKEFKKAVADAFKYDDKILIEEYVSGREIECSVLGNEKPIASLPGEVIPKNEHEFYSYEAKYIDDDGATLNITALLPKSIVKKIQTMAVATYKALQLEGMSRVDFFLKKSGSLVVNEVNTIPGFTKISMYPKMLEASGIKYADLIDKLIQFGISRFEREKRLETNVKI